MNEDDKKADEQAWEPEDDYRYDSLDDLPTLKAVANFARLLKQASWFSGDRHAPVRR